MPPLVLLMYTVFLSFTMVIDENLIKDKKEAAELISLLVPYFSSYVCDSVFRHV